MTPAIFWTVADLATQLAKDVIGQQRYILGIDGFTRSGKTSLARRLAENLDIKHLELDRYSTKLSEIYAANMDITSIARDAATHSVVVDGIHLMEIANLMKMPLYKHIYVMRCTKSGIWKEQFRLKTEADNNSTAISLQQLAPQYQRELIRYHLRFKPHETADYILKRH